MKKQFLLTIAVVSTALFSFTPYGGDVFRVYLNGRQVHQQFLHASKGSQPFQIPYLSNTDEMAVFYSHCGKTGSGRTLSFRNEKNEVVKTLHFPDASGNTSMMQFSRKDLPAGSRQMQLYYASKELPNGYLIATFGTSLQKTVAKTASL
jgi:hypothetical protein